MRSADSSWLLLPHWLSDPISCRLVSLLSGVDWPLASPFANSFSEFLWSNSSRVPLPTSGHVEISGPNPLSGFAPKQTKGLSAWRTTYIVLHNEQLNLQHCKFFFFLINTKSCLLADNWSSLPYNYNLIIKTREFFTPALADGILLILRDSKSPQVSRTLLSIVVNLNNAVVWTVFTWPLISKFSSPFANFSGLFRVLQS